MVYEGDTNIRYLLQHNNNIWNEWAFKSWVESDEYTGPDMTDFGLRSQQDEEFKVQYDEQMELFTFEDVSQINNVMVYGRRLLNNGVGGGEFKVKEFDD